MQPCIPDGQGCASPVACAEQRAKQIGRAFCRFIAESLRMSGFSLFIKASGSQTRGNTKMKKVILKALLTTSALLMASGYTVFAEAHCVGVLGNFGASGITAASTSAVQYDTYATVCPTGTAYLKARVSRKSGTVALNLEVAKGGFPSVTATDATTTATTQCDGTLNESIGIGAGAFSPNLTGGAGEYTLTVAKDGAASNYAAEFHCYDASNVEVTPAAPSGVGEIDRLMDH
jgi:hypothetical protein